MSTKIYCWNKKLCCIPEAYFITEEKINLVSNLFTSYHSFTELYLQRKCENNKEIDKIDQYLFADALKHVSYTGKQHILTNEINVRKNQLVKGSEENQFDFEKRLLCQEKRIENRKKRMSDMFEIYKNDWFVTNPPMLSRSGVCDLTPDSTNIKSVTICKNNISENMGKRTLAYMVLRIAKFFPKTTKISQLCSFSKRLKWSIFYGTEMFWEHVGLNEITKNNPEIIENDGRLERQKDFITNKEKFKSSDYKNHPCFISWSNLKKSDKLIESINELSLETKEKLVSECVKIIREGRELVPNWCENENYKTVVTKGVIKYNPEKYIKYLYKISLYFSSLKENKVLSTRIKGNRFNPPKYFVPRSTNTRKKQRKNKRKYREWIQKKRKELKLDTDDGSSSKDLVQDEDDEEDESENDDFLASRKDLKKLCKPFNLISIPNRGVKFLRINKKGLKNIETSVKKENKDWKPNKGKYWYSSLFNFDSILKEEKQNQITSFQTLVKRLDSMIFILK